MIASPRGLSQLTTSFIAYLRQGIHTHALSSLTIKFTLNTEYVERTGARGQRPVKTDDPEPPIPPHALPVTIYWLHGNLLQLCSCPSIFNCQRSRQNDRPKPVLPKLVWWAWVESNYRPHPYQGCALAN